MAASVVAAWTVVGLVLALLGVWNAWVVLVVGGGLGAVAGWAVARSGALEVVPSVERSGVGAALAVVLVVGWTLWAAWSPSEHVVLDRDPASYLTTALWLADGGSLRADVARGGLESLGTDEVVFGAGPVYEVAPGVVEFQFLHATSVVLALADAVGGSALALRTPALLAGLGLLAVYLATCLVTRRPLVSLLPLGLLGVGLPLLFVARDTYSEPLGLALLWWALLAGVVLVLRPSRPLGVVAGALFGSAVAVRVDMLVVAAVVVVLAAVAVVADESQRPRRAAAVGAAGLAALVPVAVAAVDLVVRSGGYVEDLRSELLASAALVGGSVVVAGLVVLVGSRRPDLVRRIGPCPERPADVAAVVVVLAAAFLLLVRPRLGEGVFPPGTMLEGQRTHAERSAVWMTWYLGPAGVALAVAGLALAVRRILRGRGTVALVAVVAPTLVLGALYLWRPSITPDQLWASRRYVSVVLPGLAVLAAVSLARWTSGTRPGRWWRVVGTTAAVGLCLVPLARSTWPLRDLAVQRGYLGVVEEACDLLGDDATVLVVDGWGGLTVAQAVRTVCGVPVGIIGAGFDRSSWDRLTAAADGQGRRVVVLATDREVSDGVPWPAGPTVETQTVVATRDPVRTTESLPSRYATGAEIAPPGNPQGFTLYLRDAVA